ncbi:hypothetical protein BAX94_02340 [Elizabethkingia meningoseptica]|uniref:Glycosyltransferase n=1 Tax=Elizabethkingia meningoseptica TaxID=238 RepID=A0A1T3IYR6_ELIME|nr:MULTISPECIES: hypothetical protein [Elizabethkingia]AQX12408.1 hypothetical protein BBD35_08520 [Elizabethkingia meningoseptica]EJK5329550.1 hypothetical protein [Elizabethkingia meningoseptica]MBG0513944.1 hypothetical protein [Elizabethkingia meningoseptica]MDE5430504.1 hypothetical protein [Elizabethkingia meningoseptica]MDE5432860.1 hypothetical protein [Elizabethkingia meningoseptica]
MIRLTKNSVIYILAPGGIASGGPEALHQLHYYLNKLGYNSYISYYSNPEIHPKYLIYEPKVISIEKITDHKENVIITPEIYTRQFKNYRLAKKCIWWLGVQYYDGFETFPTNGNLKAKNLLRSFIPNALIILRQKILKRLSFQTYIQQPYLIRKKDYNLCGSLFAYDYVKKRFKNVHMFVEPISLPFLLEGKPSFTSNRTSSVLYNPSKPSEIMNKLLKRTDINFIPIQGLDIPELINLFQKSLLYIDFGFFGGPERLPKETVYNGMMLLVGKRNAAINNFDVAIPEKYKIENFENEELVVSKIKYMLEHYNELINDFEEFRNKINDMEEQFIKSIKQIFVKTEDI